MLNKLKKVVKPIDLGQKATLADVGGEKDPQNKCDSYDKKEISLSEFKEVTWR